MLLLVCLNSFRKEVVMSTKINWQGPQLARNVYFTQLPVGASFRNVNGRGAIYQKVLIEKATAGRELYGMLEYATGHVFPATSAPVEEVAVEITVEATKPSIY